MKCTSCGRDNSKTAEHCEACGAEFVDPAAETHATMSDLQSSSAAARTAQSPAEVPTEFPALRPSPPRPLRTTSGSVSSPSVTGGAGGTTTELAPSTTFAGRYEILQLVGKGGMGLVYKARDLELDKVIALKTIRSEVMADPDVLKRFKRELLLARKVTHKNVVRIYDMGEAEGIKFITMEYIEGESLKHLIRRNGSLSPDQAIDVSRQILAALEEAHREDVVHRDLKPQNVIVSQKGVARIMDFGIARSNLDTAMTATGVMIGTPDYMSPEQVRSETAGPASDIFSFGVILFEMLTGELPFHGDTPVSKVMMRLTAKPRIPKEVSRVIPDYLERVLMKCMEVDPALRYQSAAEVLADLDRQRVDRSLTLPIQRALSRRWGWITAAAALVGVAVWAFLSGGTADRVATSSVPEGPVTHLTILPFTNAASASELEWLRMGLPEMLVTDISQSRFVRPVPSERVLKVLRDLGISDHTRFDESALESIASRTAAESVLYGQFVRSSGAIRLDLTLRKSGSGVPIPLEVEGSADDVFGLVDQITAKVKEHLDLTPEQIRGDNDRPVAEVSTASATALHAYQDGLAMMRRGETRAAIPRLLEATETDPDFAMAFAKLGEAHWEEREFPAAQTAIERAETLAAAEAFPTSERFQIHATAALIAHDYQRAAESYQELAQLYPEDPDIQLSLAGAYEELGRLPDAGTAYQRVIELAPSYGAAQLGLGRIEVMTGKPDAAVRSLTAAADSGQFDGDDEALGMIHLIIGVAYREMSDFDSALDHMQRSLHHRETAGDKSGQAATLSNIGDLYKYQGNLPKAVEAQEKALATARELGDKEGESNYLVALGMTYHVAEDLDKSLEAFKESLQIEMERQDLVNLANRLNKIADIYRMKGQYEDAVIYLERAKTYLDQTDEPREKAFNYSYLGLVRKAQGLFGQATEAFLEALPLFQQIHYETGAAYTHQDLADIYATQGRYSDALDSLEKSLAIHTDVGVAHEITEVKIPLARALIALGELDRAEKVLEEASAGNGDHGDGHGSHDAPPPALLFGLGQIAELRGQEDAAAKAYEDANYQANVIGNKEVAVESRVRLGMLYLHQGKVANAERLLARTREEATRSRLRPLQANASLALARARLAAGEAEAAASAALEAIELADGFSGRPTLYQAYAVAGDALEALGRTDEATDVRVKAVESFEWIRQSLRLEHAVSFRTHPEVRVFVDTIGAALDKAGRGEIVAPMRQWIAEAS